MANKYMVFKLLALFSVFIVYFSYVYYCMTVNLYCAKDNQTLLMIEPHSKLFQAYLHKFNKHYEGEEFFKRLEYFMENVREIERLNRKGGNARYGLTKSSDLSKDEFKNTFPSNSKFMTSNCEDKYKSCRRSITLDDSFPVSIMVPPLTRDWRKKGVIGPVLNQKQCNGCWAFSVVGVMESMMAIKLKRNFVSRLSIQELLDCSRDKNYTNGCKGGNAEIAMDFLCDYKVPLATEQQIPLTLRDEKCRIPRSGVELSWMDVECDYPVDKIVETIAIHGPVVAAVNAFNWNYYLDGIIQWNCRGDDWRLIKHVVQIVGYDKTGDSPYFIVRNSWGTDWGIDGYVHIAMKDFMCGFGRQISFLDVTIQ